MAVTITVKVRCVGCKATKDVAPGDYGMDPPMCDRCYMPMVAISAKSKP